MIIRDIARQVLALSGTHNPDSPLYQRTANAIGATFRAKRGTVLESDDQYPQRWWVKKA